LSLVPYCGFLDTTLRPGPVIARIVAPLPDQYRYNGGYAVTVLGAVIGKLIAGNTRVPNDFDFQERGGASNREEDREERGIL